MNKRIEQLVEQCYEKHELLDTYQFNKQKFAELIIRECAGICFSEAAGHGMAFGEHCGIIIKEHFGIES